MTSRFKRCHWCGIHIAGRSWRFVSTRDPEQEPLDFCSEECADDYTDNPSGAALNQPHEKGLSDGA